MHQLYDAMYTAQQSITKSCKKGRRKVGLLRLVILRKYARNITTVRTSLQEMASRMPKLRQMAMRTSRAQAAGGFTRGFESGEL